MLWVIFDDFSWSLSLKNRFAKRSCYSRCVAVAALAELELDEFTCADCHQVINANKLRYPDIDWLCLDAWCPVDNVFLKLKAWQLLETGWNGMKQSETHIIIFHNMQNSNLLF